MQDDRFWGFCDQLLYPPLEPDEENEQDKEKWEGAQNSSTPSQQPKTTKNSSYFFSSRGNPVSSAWRKPL